MNTILDILHGTPAWVFVLPPLLLWYGFMSRNPRVILWQQAMIAPAIFVTWGLISLVQSPVSPLFAGLWIVATLAGFGSAFLISEVGEVRADRAPGRVHMPGSWLPLIRSLLIFVGKYGLGVAIATHPLARAELAPWDIAVSGASAGYFIAWLVIFARHYRRAVVVVT